MMWPMLLPMGIQIVSFVSELGYDISYAWGAEKQLELRQKYRPVQADKARYGGYDTVDYYDTEPEYPEPD